MQTQDESKLQQFWKRVREQRQAIEAALKAGKLPTNPESKAKGVVFIVSVDNYDRGTSAGVVSEAASPLAAQRLAEGTHILANEDQVETYLLDQAEKAERIKSKDAVTRMRRVAGSLMGDAAQVAMQPVK